jgi:hypothetical protein
MPIIVSPPGAKPLRIPTAVLSLSTSGINSEATAAITTPAAKCWIALLAFNLGTQKQATMPPRTPAALAIMM